MPMKFNLNSNKSNNIKKANQSKPQHSFNPMAKNQNNQSVKKPAKITTMKIDENTLNDLKTLKAILHFDTLADTVSNLTSNLVIPTLIKQNKITRDEFKQIHNVVKLLK